MTACFRPFGPSSGHTSIFTLKCKDMYNIFKILDYKRYGGFKLVTVGIYVGGLVIYHCTNIKKT
jgi:hypothetical protein